MSRSRAPLDPGLLVRGGPEAESISVTADAAKVTVTSSQPLAAGAGMRGASAGTVTCARRPALGYATVWSGGGDDQVSLGPGFPVTARSRSTAAKATTRSTARPARRSCSLDRGAPTG